MILTLEQLKKILPINKEVELWLPILNKYLPLYDIASRDRVIMFMTQTSHESSQYIHLEENLNYSQLGLLKIFPKYFNLADSVSYARQPQKIASRIYANRYHNGNEASGDGWKYRGRGVIGTTFKSNYEDFATFMKISLDDVMKLIQTKEGAILSGIFFWKEHQLNSFADAHDINGASKRINGGLIGLRERQLEYKRISTIL